MGRGRQHYLTRSNVFLTSSMKAVFVLISILLGLLSWTEKSQSLVKKFSGSEYGEIIVKPLERSVREERIGKNKKNKQRVRKNSKTKKHKNKKSTSTNRKQKQTFKTNRKKKGPQKRRIKKKKQKNRINKQRKRKETMRPKTKY